MRILLSISLTLFVINTCVAQGEFNNWYFGHYCGITFNSGEPVFLPGNPNRRSYSKAEASVSDSSGKFLFFSNGLRVWNCDLEVMPNGNGLFGNSTACQVIAVQHVGDPNLYYLFTVSCRPAVGDTLVGAHFSVIDMELDGGKGDIVSGMKNIPLPLCDTVYTEVFATRHRNNRDAWVVFLEHGIDENYLAFLIDSNGLNTIPIVSPSTLKNSVWPTGLSSGVPTFMRISQNGEYLFCTDSLTEFCLFNNATGEVIPQFRFWPGLGDKPSESQEFSIDSKFVYFTTQSGPPAAPYRAVVQYNMTEIDSAGFMQSQAVVGDSCGQGIQMAPDGKIYVTSCNANSPLHRINSPSAPGAGCNYQRSVFDLQGNPHYSCLPQFLERYKVYIHHSGQCQYFPISFSADFWPPPDSLCWNFGDPGSGAANTSNDTTPSHAFTSAGNYIVELFVRHIDLRTDTARITLTILEAPETDLGPDSVICYGDSITYDAGSCTGCTYQWDNLLTGQYNIANTQTYTAYDSGIYVVTVANPNGCNGADTTQLSIIDGVHVMAYPVSMEICSGDTAQVSLQCTYPPCDFSWTALASSPLVSGYSDGTGVVIDQSLYLSLIHI